MSKSLIEMEKESIMPTYKRLPIVVDYAKGMYIYDKNGDSFLDFLGGIAVNALGHCYPRTIDAIEKQIRKYTHISNYFYQEPQLLLAEKLTQMTGYKSLFYTNSGTEAIEGAMKLVRRWGNLNNREEIFAFSGGFHGRTYAALSLMDKPHYKDKMGPFLEGIKVIRYNDINGLQKSVNKNTNAVFLEFIQGEGGIVEADKEFVETLFDLRDKFGFLIVADEIQSGVGRTGKFFGFNHYDVKPDVIAMAKGIGGGMPLGCLLVREGLEDIWEKGMHGTTYGGNAVACAAGMTVLDELENGLMDDVTKIGNYFKNELKKVKQDFPDLVLEVRGKGLMLGLLLNFDASILVNKLLDKKVITNAASGNVLRLVPPLIVKESEVDIFISKLRESLGEIN